MPDVVYNRCAISKNTPFSNCQKKMKLLLTMLENIEFMGDLWLSVQLDRRKYCFLRVNSMRLHWSVGSSNTTER